MKKKIALVTGGYTGESVISLKSAAVVERTRDKEKYEVIKILIYPGDWHHITDSGEKVMVDLNDFSLTIAGSKTKFDGVFNILHGSPGEDGKLAGYFDMIGLPYTTCGQLTSAITMNKGYTKAIVDDIPELHIAKSIQLFENTAHHLTRIKSELTLPLFIKPNNGGSSIGMSKVKNWEELPEALNKAFAEDSQVLVDRIVTQVYEKLNCKGAVRIDYFLETGTGKFYFIEINTVPGQTETSLISQQVKATGKDVKEFYTELIEEMFS